MKKIKRKKTKKTQQRKNVTNFIAIKHKDLLSWHLIFCECPHMHILCFSDCLYLSGISQNIRCQESQSLCLIAMKFFTFFLYYVFFVFFLFIFFISLFFYVLSSFFFFLFFSVNHLFCTLDLFIILDRYLTKCMVTKCLANTVIQMMLLDHRHRKCIFI